MLGMEQRAAESRGYVRATEVLASCLIFMAHFDYSIMTGAGGLHDASHQAGGSGLQFESKNSRRLRPGHQSFAAYAAAPASPMIRLSK
jgi:hypothetical protein